MHIKVSLQSISRKYHYLDPGRNLVLVVPNCLTAEGMTRDGDRTSAKDKLYESVPSRLCSQPLPPENPSATIQQLLKPRFVSVLATIFAESEYLKVLKITQIWKRHRTKKRK